MKAEEVGQFAKIIEVYRATNYDKQQDPLTADAITVYAAVLQNYSLERVHAAIRAHVADPDRCRWFPKGGDIIHQLRVTAERPERRAVTAIAPPERSEGPCRLAELTAEATERYAAIVNDSRGTMAERQRAATLKWKADMRKVDPNWGGGRR